MCGIAGFVDFSGRPAADWTAALERMHAAITHRGPDGWGRLVIEGDGVREWSARGETTGPRVGASRATVGFAHARLSILDLSEAGRQPMSAAGGAGWIAYNGEIYNYRAHWDRLRGRGVRLRSTSDTEVLAELLALEGPEALGGLRGMFAFAWWDEGAGRLLLVRDRLGIKPLVYARPLPGLTLFASEPRALMASGLVHPAVRPERAAEFFSRGSIGADRSVWTGVEAVAPATYVAVDACSVAPHTYWSLDRTLLEDGPPVTARSAATSVRRAVLDSVDAHLVSDVPVAIFLSGGLDSTAVLAAARRVSTGPIQTCTVSMPGSRLDESAEARAIAKHFGSDHLEVSLDDIDVDRALDEFFGAMQAPTVDGFNTFLVARAARQAGVKVALAGVGGDELFGGYDSFTGVSRVAAFCAAARPAAAGVAAALRRWPGSRGVKLAAIVAARPRTIAGVWWEYRRLFDEPDVRALTGAAGESPEELPAGVPAFSAIRLLEVRHFLQRQLLADSDAFTMCRALELRTPLVDHTVAEAVARAGRWPRAHGVTFKQSLFREMPELTAPGATGRPKQGFVLPFEAWVRDALTQPAAPRLQDFAARLRQRRYEPFVRRFLQHRLHWSRLWAIYVFDRLTEAWRPSASQ